MKIMIVGSDEVYSIENFYVKYFQKGGQETLHYPAQSIFFKYYYKSLVHKVLFKMGFSGILQTINNELKKTVENFQPEVIWVFKGMELYPETIRWIQDRGIKTANYNPDNPFLFTGKGSGNKNVTESIQLYNLHFTYNLEIEAKLKDAYNANTFFLPFGFEINEELYHECANQGEALKACFLGNPDPQRAGFLDALANTGVVLDVYGNNWNRFVSHKNITVYQPVYGNTLWKTLRKYRVQLNLLRIHNEQSHNMRTFEVPGIGGIMLAPDTPEHRLFFEDGKEAFFYNNVEECSTRISEILSLTKSEADTVRINARTRSVKDGYSYEARARQALGVINRLVR